MKSILLLTSVLAIQSTAFASEAAASVERNSKATGDFNDPFASESAPQNGHEPKQGEGKVSDPLEPMNRVFFTVNDRLYFWVLKPTAKGYKTVTPQSLRESLARLFANAKFPVRFVNNLLEARFKGAGIELTRFVVNSTVGVGGLFDPATHWKLVKQPAGFDQTLAVYGLPTGCYVCLPILGPSSVRGAAGEVGDVLANPLTYIDFPAITYSVPPSQIVNGTSLHLGEYEAVKKSTLDPYVAVRSAYLDNLRHNGGE